ncbi:MAG TPA: NADH-quinone oxidoreductase subunit J [Desulfomonilaceae bacterium]|nr:NADH-quinone oxidoreductase subunit J [Desulfomonilaceae bacterium]
MNFLFYISAAIAVLSTVMVVTRPNPVHGLLYLVLSLFSVALVFLSLGANFAAALEVIVYAGAIMVLFVFVILLINPGSEATDREKRWLTPGIWVGPSILAVVLLLELIYVLAFGGGQLSGVKEVTPKEVGLSLFGPYVLGVELASMLLLAAIVGAYHLGRRRAGEGDES